MRGEREKGGPLAQDDGERPQRKCVFVLGPEGSGSKLAARICADALGIRAFERWDGDGWCDEGFHRVLHRSLPYGDPPRFPDVVQWIRSHEDEFDLCFVITTRDRTLSEYSRLSRFPKSRQQVRAESEDAKATMVEVMRSGEKYLVWSYETFMFLETAYLEELHRFLGVESDFAPRLVDGNETRVSKGLAGRWHLLRTVCERYLRALRSMPRK